VCVLFVCQGRAGRGVEGEEFIYVRGGPEGAWRRRHTFIGDGPVVGVAAEEAYFFRHFFGSEGRTLM